MNAVPSQQPARSFCCTIFRDNKGTVINASRDMDMRELERVIRAARPARDKDAQPLLKLARFGEIKSPKGSLRHDPNVIAVSGIEGDYDGSAVPMTMQHAADILSSFGIGAMLYTTVSNTPEAPRWRVIAHLAFTLEGTEAELRLQRAHWVGVLNALLSGVLKHESFVLSQSFYFGQVANTPAPEIIRLEGVCIDQIEDPPAPVLPEGSSTAVTTRRERDEKAVAGLTAIVDADHIYSTTRDYAARLVAKGFPRDEAELLLRGFLLGHREAWNTGDQQRARFDEVLQKLPRMFDGAAGKYEPPSDDDPLAHNDGWQEPVDILRDLSARAFDAADVPSVLSEYAKAYADNTGFDPSLTLTSAVCVAAAALSDVFQIVADSKTQWMQSARLWMLGIGRSGAGKTPAQREMLAPLWTIQRELMDEYDRTVRDLPEEERKHPPPRPRVILVDTTVEALSEVLQHNERGVVIANDEFEGFMGSLDQYRGKGPSRDRAEYLRLFDGGPHTVERVQRGSVFVRNWGVSIMSATTPSVLSKLARYLPEDGLLQRFIVVCVEKQRSAVSSADIEPARARYHETIRRLYNATPRAHKGKVPLSLEAANLFHTWRAEHQLGQEAMGAISTAFESHLAKHATLVLRIALVFHAAQIVNQPATEARDIAAFAVPAETMQRAIRFMRRASQHAMSVYLGMQGGSQGFELARDIGRAVIAHGGSQVARRDLIHRVRAFRAADAIVQNTALRVLIDAGWLRYAEGGYSKEVPARYEVNPLLATRLATDAARERQRRAVVREMIAEAIGERRKG